MDEYMTKKIIYMIRRPLRVSLLYKTYPQRWEGVFLVNRNTVYNRRPTRRGGQNRGRL